MTNTKFTAVVPIRWLVEPPHTDFLRTLPARLLLLAHDILDKAYSTEEVQNALFMHKTLHKDQHIIMDNSASEKVPLEDFQLIEAYAKLGNGSSSNNRLTFHDIELVLPDVLCDGEATIVATVKFLNYVERLDLAERLKFFYIPQGSSLIDFQQNLIRFRDIMYNTRADISCIGIPRNLVPRLFPTRAYAIALVRVYFPTVDIHLLGFTDNVAEDINDALNPYFKVRSIDSAVPLRASGEGIVLSCKEETFARQCSNIGPRGDWFEDPSFSSFTLFNILQTIDVFKEKR